MGSIWGGTKTVKKVDRQVKNIASAPRRSVQRETGNASGVASGHSKSGNAQKAGSIGGREEECKCGGKCRSSVTRYDTRIVAVITIINTRDVGCTCGYCTMDCTFCGRSNGGGVYADRDT